MIVLFSMEKEITIIYWVHDFCRQRIVPVGARVELVRESMLCLMLRGHWYIALNAHAPRKKQFP